MVRLGVSSISSISVSSISFQFQYGSIGSDDVQVQAKKVGMFQFQYGSIGSPTYENSKFSIMRFNSSMVRLGVALVCTFGHRANLFQFQYGSIGRSKAI